MSVLNPFSESSSPLLDPSGDHRAATLRAAEERAAFRRSELEAQSSPAIAPHERIRLWERLHALQLPRSAEHKLLRVIAADTGLTVRQLHEEQLRRAGASESEQRR